MIACGVVKNGIHGSLGAQNAEAALARNRIRRFSAPLLCVVFSDIFAQRFFNAAETLLVYSINSQIMRGRTVTVNEMEFSMSQRTER
jgi:hypothetical protein